MTCGVVRGEDRAYSELKRNSSTPDKNQCFNFLCHGAPGRWICGMLHAFQHRDKNFDRDFFDHVLQEAALVQIMTSKFHRALQKSKADDDRWISNLKHWIQVCGYLPCRRKARDKMIAVTDNVFHDFPREIFKVV